MIDKEHTYLKELAEYHFSADDMRTRYIRMRALLERVTKDLVKDEKLEFSNLFARLHFVCEKRGMNKGEIYRINCFRIHANRVLHEDFRPTESTYLFDLKAFCYTLAQLFDRPVPPELLAVLPGEEEINPRHRTAQTFTERIRLRVDHVDKEFIYGFDEARASEDPVRCRYGVEGMNQIFNPTVERLWKGCQLNLLDVSVVDNILVPRRIILEPDYLIDISSLAECFRDEGACYLNFFRARLTTVPNKPYLLIGNIANTMLDELIHEREDEPVTYHSVMQKSFRLSPLELSACEEIDTDFDRLCRSHFEHIRRIASEVMPGVMGDLADVLVEPSFVCEKLGLQGRLDMLSGDMRSIIELKSGSADTFPPPLRIKTNNYVQTLLYYALLNANFGTDESRRAFILYSKHNMLLPATRLESLTQEALNIRNLIVATEHGIATAGSDATTWASELINSLTADNLFADRRLPPWSARQLAEFRAPIDRASDLERAYFFSFYAFAVKELYTAKAGQPDYDSNRGVSSLWHASLSEKQEAGEILTDLMIESNRADEEIPLVTLRIPQDKNAFLPNFRAGDVVILYQREQPTDNATTRQVFKGSLVTISDTELTVRLRNRQRSRLTLPTSVRYAIEHDHLDASYHSMFRGLYNFLSAPCDRRDLLLNLRRPAFDESVRLSLTSIPEHLQDIILRAKQARDYFLLTGPPGTGKTSLALRYLVEELLTDPSASVLLLSYTNRAVDEICDSLENVSGGPDFIRISSELSCDPKHRSRLLEQVTEECTSRAEVRRQIQECRLFVGTIAAISGKQELFRLKSFACAIIDEASQISEPALIGLLSARDRYDRSAIRKFILIGDHKQLPAIVLQRDTHTAVDPSDAALIGIGLLDRKDSFFQRLYNLHRNEPSPRVHGFLSRQGRMHPEIAAFPNEHFYGGRLHPVPLAHQLEALDYPICDPADPWQCLVTTRRLAFLPSKRDLTDPSNKSNGKEAEITARVVRAIHQLYTANNFDFSPRQTIGIITPYRNQIALIRRHLAACNVPFADMITVDTVERFQGSQRDIIIYSFCLNRPYQLEILPNLCEDSGQVIDRKLNVALTRARKQLFITGDPDLLARNGVYAALMRFVHEKGGTVMPKA